MSRSGCAGGLTIATMTLVAVLLGESLRAQSGAPRGEWPTYGGDLGHTRYAPLGQISAENFHRLEVAWRFKTDNLGPRPEFNFQATPLVVRGVLYTTAGSRRAVVALDAATGELLWVYNAEREGERGLNAPRQLSGRGLAYWSDGREERILYVTPGYRLIALDARTGRRIPTFGQDGVVDLKLDLDQDVDLVTGEIGLHATPIVARDLVIVGAAHRPGGAPRSKRNVKGYVRAFDVRTGKRAWIFHTIPLPGGFGHETWEDESWSYTGNTGVWAQISVDETLGIIYLPVETPTGDYYGGHRPGAGLFGESLVAVDLRTGRRKWHHQLVHHGIWDWDLPCAPMLVDITVQGKPVRAVAQLTKQAFVFVFDRLTGQPIWPIEERPVPRGDVPGEWYSPTQPFPVKPPPFDRQGVTLDDLIDFTPELRAEAEKLVARYRIGPIFTPPVVSRAEGPLATLMLPSVTGGANWPGGSFDPETHILYVFSQTNISAVGLVKPTDPNVDFAFVQGSALTGPRPAAAPAPAAPAASSAPSSGMASSSDPPRPPGGGGGGGEGGGAALTVQGLPLVKPPYGRITAIDLDTGDIVWQRPHGETPDAVRNHPALKGLAIPRTGQPGYVGTLVTKTLLIAGESRAWTTPYGRGAMLRAYDKATGAEVGAVYLPAPQTGSPMTYLVNGRQYLVVAVSGAGYSGELIAFRLPDSN